MRGSRRSLGSFIRRHLALILASALALPALVSCGNSDIECEIDPLFKESEQLQIRQAAADWNARSSRTIRFAPDGEWLVLPASVPKGLGLEQSRRRLIRISPETPHDQIYAVALHELGHAIGLKHVSQGVMDGERQTIAFSEEDMAECRRVEACP